jgi:hypothetical protein
MKIELDKWLEAANINERMKRGRSKRATCLPARLMDGRVGLEISNLTFDGVTRARGFNQ